MMCCGVCDSLQTTIYTITNYVSYHPPPPSFLPSFLFLPLLPLLLPQVNKHMPTNTSDLVSNPDLVETAPAPLSYKNANSGYIDKVLVTANESEDRWIKVKRETERESVCVCVCE